MSNWILPWPTDRRHYSSRIGGVKKGAWAVGWVSSLFFSFIQSYSFTCSGGGGSGRAASFPSFFQFLTFVCYPPPPALLQYISFSSRTSAAEADSTNAKFDFDIFPSPLLWLDAHQLVARLTRCWPYLNLKWLNTKFYGLWILNDDRLLYLYYIIG